MTAILYMHIFKYEQRTNGTNWEENRDKYVCIHCRRSWWTYHM